MLGIGDGLTSLARSLHMKAKADRSVLVGIKVLHVQELYADCKLQ